MKKEDFDLNYWKIGSTTAGDPTIHLKRFPKMVIILGEKRSLIEVYGHECNGGRPRYVSTTVTNFSLVRQARELALKWKILRKAIEVKNEDS